MHAINQVLRRIQAVAGNTRMNGQFDLGAHSEAALAESAQQTPPRHLPTRPLQGGACWPKNITQDDQSAMPKAFTAMEVRCA